MQSNMITYAIIMYDKKNINIYTQYHINWPSFRYHRRRKKKGKKREKTMHVVCRDVSKEIAK